MRVLTSYQWNILCAVDATGVDAAPVSWDEVEYLSPNPYATLASLERRGLITSEWSPWDDTMLYTITDEGRRTLGKTPAPTQRED